MCGICGVHYFFPGKQVNVKELFAMNDLLKHRGPDDDGWFIKDNTALAMRRLAIIDVKCGQQPVFNEDKSVCAVMNGEIYNFPLLREQLIKDGHIFKSLGDTEVLVHLYEAYGDDFVKHLRGMFAVALWDDKQKKLLLARDKTGKKPLFYCNTGERLVFSSELRSISSAQDVGKEICLQAVDLFLTLQYIPSPLTIYQGVYKLPPASLMIVKDGKTEIRNYYDLPLNTYNEITDLTELKQKLYQLTDEAVKIRLQSEVPVGSFLSGGLDSSVVTALMAKNSPEKINTFSIGFNEKQFSELPFAKTVADMYGANHHEIILEPDIEGELENIARVYGEPFADPSSVPMYFISKETKKYVTVALSGDGGDEVFGGYNRYRAMLLEKRLRFMPDFIKAAGVGVLKYLPKQAPFDLCWKAEKFLKMSRNEKLSDKYLYAMSFFKREDCENLYTKEFLYAVGGRGFLARDYMANMFNSSKGENLLNKLVYADYHSYLPDDLMTKTDMASMASSLEVRSPLLDSELFRFMFTLPQNTKINGLFAGNTKNLFRETFKDIIPPQIAKRGKMGFGIPVGQWLNGRLKHKWQEYCFDEHSLISKIVKREKILSIAAQHYSGKCDNGYKMWALLMLELWFKQFAKDFKI